MRVSIDPTDPGFRPGMLDRICPERYAVFLDGELCRDRIVTADDADGAIPGLLIVERDDARLTWIGKVEIVRIGTRKLGNGWIVDVKPDRSGGPGFSVGAWPSGDPVEPPADRQRWYFDNLAQRAADPAEALALVDEVARARPPIPRRHVARPSLFVGL